VRTLASGYQANIHPLALMGTSLEKLDLAAEEVRSCLKSSGYRPVEVKVDV
jgi:hypothetical protein